MSRHPAVSTLFRLPLLVALAVLPAACGGGGGEEQLLNSFFRAARSRDNMTLGNIAAVGFHPNTEGVVERFSITDVSPEQRRVIDLRELSDAHTRAQQEEAAFSEKRRDFQSANVEAINRATNAQSTGQPLRGADAEVYASLERWRDEHNEYTRKLSDAQARLNRDRAQVVNSLSPPGGASVDISDMELELVTKKVTVDATVRTPEGETVPRTLVFTMQRAVGTRDGATTQGRWIITDLQ